MQLKDIDVHHLHIGDVSVDFHNNMECDNRGDDRIIFFSAAGREDFLKIKAKLDKEAAKRVANYPDTATFQGQPIYLVKTPLDEDEEAWLSFFLDKNDTEARFDEDIMEFLMELGEQEARDLFLLMWMDNAGHCGTCGALEGKCLNSTCTRTRVTNKLFLFSGGVVADGWKADQMKAMERV